VQIGRALIGAGVQGVELLGDGLQFKVDLAVGALRRFRCVRYPITAEELVADIDAGNAPWPALVLAGARSAEARRET
jgi:hypothetical protein